MMAPYMVGRYCMLYAARTSSLMIQPSMHVITLARIRGEQQFKPRTTHTTVLAVWLFLMQSITISSMVIATLSVPLLRSWCLASLSCIITNSLVLMMGEMLWDGILLMMDLKRSECPMTDVMDVMLQCHMTDVMRCMRLIGAMVMTGIWLITATCVN